MHFNQGKAILMVSFGSSHLDTLEKNIGKMERQAQETFPEYRIYRAFTSKMILQKLKETKGLCIDTVEEALQRMLEDGIKEVIVQPTYIINGAENDAMLHDLQLYENRFFSLQIGKPLLSDPEDYKRAVQALMKETKPEKEEVLILMGHGTRHHANAAYAALEYMFHYLGYGQVLVGTVEGFPGLPEVMTKLAYTGKKQVRLLPFMFVAGEHAKEDMAGEDASWKTQLEQNGYKVEAQIKGLGELGGIREIYMEHIKAAKDEKEKKTKGRVLCLREGENSKMEKDKVHVPLSFSKNQRQLRAGYTTGSCAAAAAKAAAYMLLSGETVQQVSLTTPKGITLYLEVEETQRAVKQGDAVSCAIRKDSGDDPDVTNGILIYAGVSPCKEGGLHLIGGEGIGIVTRKGLEQAVGEPAINKVPRQMILEAVQEQCARFGYQGGLEIRIWIPGGRALAKQTFNPRLGIEGGISVLGTSGIVEPMSEKALTDTIYLEMKVLRENGSRWCYVVPGNYGSDFLTQTLQFDGSRAVKCSNYIGEAIDDAVLLGMKGILLVGHVGKLIKLAAGVMNTHSAQADGRMEILTSHAAMAGASRELVTKLMRCLTTTEAIELLKEEKLLQEVMESVMERIAFHLEHRSGEQLCIGAILFSMEEGILGCTPNAEAMIEHIQGENYERNILRSGCGTGRSGTSHGEGDPNNTGE